MIRWILVFVLLGTGYSQETALDFFMKAKELEGQGEWEEARKMLIKASLRRSEAAKERFGEYKSQERFLVATSTISDAKEKISFLQEGQFISDGDCKVYNPYPKPKESIRYEGDCENGLAHGKGKLFWFNRGKKIFEYEGDFEEGKLHGLGLSQKGDESLYFGYWQDSQRMGLGIKQTPEGIYSLSWIQNKPVFGISYLKSGEVYRGGLDILMRAQGFGILQKSTDESLLGNFKDGQLHGYGVQKTAQSKQGGFFDAGNLIAQKSVDFATQAVKLQEMVKDHEEFFEKYKEQLPAQNQR